MFAYVTRSNFKKNELQNYLTLLVDKDKIENMEEGDFTQMFLYRYESLLTHSRQYHALMNLKNLSIAP